VSGGSGCWNFLTASYRRVFAEGVRRIEASAPDPDDTLSALRLRALQHRHHASPNKPTYARIHGRLSGRGLLLAICLFVFATGVSGALAAPESPAGCDPVTAKANTQSPGKNQPPAKAKPAAKAQSPAKTPVKKTQVAAANVKKAKPAAPPMVSATTKAKAETITQEISPTLPESVEQEISKFFGLRYRFGGNGQGGIDCSALVQKVYSDAFGIELPRSSKEQSQVVDLETVSSAELKTGDLLFFGPQRKRVDHVGMYLSGGYFLHAARSEGVTISRLDHDHWKARFMFSKRPRGLEIEEQSAGENAFETELARNSAAFAFSSFESGGLLSTIDAGISLDDSFELILSGFFLNALSGTPPGTEGSLFADHAPAEASQAEAGFRLAALLSPLEWLGISPSISQVENSRAKDKTISDEPYQKIGLETWMVLPSSKVAVFMAAHVNNQEALLNNPTRVSPDWQSLDVALGLHYRLSDALRFSLYSTHAYGQDSKLSDESSRPKLTLEDVGFQLNVRF
jgi:cell wall-associated NlpC family hydrolase